MTWHKPSIGDVWLAYVEFADHSGYDHEKARALAYVVKARAFCYIPANSQVASVARRMTLSGASVLSGERGMTWT